MGHIEEDGSGDFSNSWETYSPNYKFVAARDQLFKTLWWDRFGRYRLYQRASA